MSEPKVYIIIINVDASTDTLECVRSILQNKYSNYSIIIVENSRNDEEYLKLKGYLRDEGIPHFGFDREEIENVMQPRDAGSARVILLRNRRVSGFSENNNLGIRYARSAGDFQYIWILNNDTVISPNSLAALVEYAEANRLVGITGSVLLFYDNPSTIQALGGGKNHPLLGGIKTFCKGKDKSVAEKIGDAAVRAGVNMISGASSLLRKELLDEIGLMDETYFLYGEDLDYSTRAIKAGWKIGVATASVVLHKHNTLTRKKSLVFYYYHNFRSYTIYLRKNERVAVVLIGLCSLLINSFRKTRSFACVKAGLQGIISGASISS